MSTGTATESQGAPSETRNRGGHQGAGIGTTLAAAALAVAVLALALNFVLPGPSGLAGTNYSTSTVLQSGQTESGIYAAYGGNGSFSYSDAINYRIPLPSNLDSANATFISAGGSFTTNCTGPGHALPDHLCVYEESQVNRLAPGFFGYTPIFDPVNGSLSTHLPSWGFGLVFIPTAYTSYSQGTWSVGGP